MITQHHNQYDDCIIISIRNKPKLTNYTSPNPPWHNMAVSIACLKEEERQLYLVGSVKVIVHVDAVG